MKNITFYSILFILLIIGGIFIFKLTSIDREPVIPKENIVIETSQDIVLREDYSEAGQEEGSTKSISSDDIDKAESYAKEFNLPEDIREEFLDIIGEGEATSVQNDSAATDEELNEAGISSAQIAETLVGEEMENITSGYDVDDQNFDEMVSACLPTGINEASDSAALKSQALATMGFSAIAEYRYEQAEKAFTNLIQSYPDEEPTQMARLEYSNLLAEQGRTNEAKQVLNEATTINSSDNEYVSMANSLNQKIERSE